MEELISIIVPIYNVEDYLKRCLETIMQQTYKNLEIILVNDGSTDHSETIIQEFVEKDSRFVAVKKENGGLSDARNAGIEIAAGKFLIFVDSDDYIHPQFVEMLHWALKKTDSDIAVCQSVEVDEKEVRDFENERVSEKRVDVLDSVEGMKFWYTSSFRTPTVAWNKIYKRELFSSERFAVGRYHEDEFIMHRLFMKASRIAYLWADLYYYVQRSNSITGARAYSIKRLDVLDAYEDRRAAFKTIGDTELEYLHILQYIDVLLGCSADIMEKYHKPDQKKYLNELKSKLLTLSSGRHIAWKQYFKLTLFRYAPHLYVKLYRKIKG